MKKLFIIIIVLLCVSGCKKEWEKNVQISELKYEDNYIVGRMKNLTDKAYNVTITFKVKSGSLVDSKYCYELLRPNDIIDLECLAYNIDETYEIEIEDIKFEEVKIPQLEIGIINEETLEYHFEDIYKAHELNFISFTANIDEENYPYIEGINYNGNEINIKGNISNGENILSYTETYDVKSGDLTSLFIFILSDEEFLNTVTTKISLMQSITRSSSESISILKTLKRTDIEVDYCVKVGTWCINTGFSGNGTIKTYSFYRR